MANELDAAFDVLKTFDWGKNIDLLKAIDNAVVATHGDAAARKNLETRLAALLVPDSPRDAKDFACRKLMAIGTAASVPALAALLSDKDNSHMARYALERISAPEAAEALRLALPKVNGAAKIGIIGSLGVRRDVLSVDRLVGLLANSDPKIVCAAACALGNIGTPEAAKALTKSAKTVAVDAKPALADARLACAEQLLADGKKAASLAVYKSLGSEDQPKHVRLAAKRGLVAAIAVK